MSNEQKLREALQAISHIDDTTNHSVDASAALDRIGQIARQALALPTAAPNTPLEQDAASILFALRDAWPYVHKSCTIDSVKNRIAHLMRKHGDFADIFPQVDTQKTAAPVGERETFEREMRCEEEWGHRSLKKRQNGQYENWQVDLMWDVWQARAALSAGDAVDAQRYRWLADCNNYEAGLALIIDPKLTEQALGAAIDAAILVRGEGDPLTRYRVWPDGTVQEGAESPYTWMSDDFEYVEAVNEEQAALSAAPRKEKP